MIRLPLYRLSIALCALFSLHLATSLLKLLFLTGFLPLSHTLIAALVILALIALTYFTTLEASPLYFRYQDEAKLYALAGFVGIVLALV